MRLINWLKDRKKEGHKLILWTCREGEPLEKAVKWCECYGLTFDAVNDNLPETIEKYGTNPRKIYCDFMLDDTHFTSEYYMRKKAQETKIPETPTAFIIRKR